MRVLQALILAVYLFLIIGYIKCVVKAFNCDWEPVGKAEVLYTAGSVTGLGCIIGWIDIKDK